jgi:hypothetical protein
MGPSEESSPETIHYFVDEAGDPTLFSAKGKILVGTEGCSRYFILGKLDVEDPVALTAEMETLRNAIANDPYFKGIPSLKPEAKKTALMFHAKDDLPEVRREVFKLLMGQKVRFYAVVRDKAQATVYESRQREKDPKYRYRPNDMYDALVSHLFRSRLYRADIFNICFSRRGNSDRTAALRKAIERAVHEFERDFGIQNRAEISITSTSPIGSGGLQAVDYFLWALQRFYEYQGTQKEESECRYVQMLWPLMFEINDLDFLAEGHQGRLWNHQRPLTLEAHKPKTAQKKGRRI